MVSHTNNNKHVHFQDNVEVWDMKNSPPPLPAWMWAIGALLAIAIFVLWVVSLVRMGHCNGRKSWLWWCTIFIPIFVPGVGQVWAVVVGILALARLNHGKSLAGMSCPKP